MRGNYYSTPDPNRAIPSVLDALDALRAFDAPTVIPSPDTPAFAEDVRAIIAYVAWQVLQSEFDWSESDLRDTYPALKGITSAQIQQTIHEALA